MNNIAIIPARSGSKGLPDKNIKLLGGRPLLAYSIDAAIGAGVFDEVMVSTDSQKYADIAVQNGAKVPFLRSKENSSDTASSDDAIVEVLTWYEKNGRRFDTMCLLQPTSPLRTSDDIVKAYHLYEEKEAAAVTSVCEVDHPPSWSMFLPDDDSMEEFRKADKGVPRQALGTCYRLNGAIYIRKIEYMPDCTPNVLITPEYAYKMDRRRSIDIDEAYDFMIAEALLGKVD